MSAPPDRADVVAMLATFGDRGPQAVPEKIDSLELAWLVHQAEQRYGVTLDLADDELTRMDSVTAAVDILGRALAGATSNESVADSAEQDGAGHGAAGDGAAHG